MCVLNHAHTHIHTSKILLISTGSPKLMNVHKFTTNFSYSLNFLRKKKSIHFIYVKVLVCIHMDIDLREIYLNLSSLKDA